MQENQAKEKDTMSKTEAYIDKSRRVCTLSKNIIDMLVKQLGAELSNMHIYRTFANYYGTNGLPSLEEYYLKRAEEEYLHHSWIYWYLSYCDATFQYPQIDAVNINIASNEYPFLQQ
jgi:ferritin